jgi:uncharacterized repeat protein (TIGR01451 family)
VYGAQVGDILSNTAEVAYQIDGMDKNSTTNEVNLTVAQTPATIEFLQVDSRGGEAILNPTTYEGSGGAVSVSPATLPDGTVIPTPSTVQATDTGEYGQQDLVIIRVVDLDQNRHAGIQDSIDVNVTNPRTGEIETLHLLETGPNTGVFVGYLHTEPCSSSASVRRAKALAAGGSSTVRNGAICVMGGDRIDATYVDNGTARHIEVEAVIMEEKFKLLTSKTQSKDSAGIGEFVKYSVTVENISDQLLRNVLIEDRLPEGVKYQDGSFKVNGVKRVGTLSADGRTISYSEPSLSPGASVEISYVVLITAGIIHGEAINRAWASAALGGKSNIATTTLKVKEELYRSRGFILGQIYDANITCKADKASPKGKEAVVAASSVLPVEGESSKPQGCGVEGVKLYMEDGRFVVTDKEGKYHFADVANGTHVVQMDEESFKGRYKLAQCRNNTRFAGSSRSQFVDLYHGELARADFCLERLPGVTGKAELSLSIRKKSKTEIELTISIGENMHLVDPEVFLALSEGLAYVKDSISHHIEPKRSEEMLMVKLGKSRKVTLTLKTLEGANPDKEIRGILYFDTQLTKNQRSDIAQVMFSTDRGMKGVISQIVQAEDRVSLSAVGGKTPSEAGDYNWTKATHQIAMPKYTPDEVDALGKSPQIVWPPKGWVPDIPSTRVAILYPKGTTVELRLNGSKVSMLNYEGIFRSSDRQMNIMHYKGVDLREQGNTFVATIKRNGRVIKRVSRKVFVESRTPKHIAFLPAYSYLVADGKHTPIIAIRMIGPSGHPLRGGMVGSFTTDSKHAPKVMSNGKGQYTIDSQGIAYIPLEPTAIAGEATLYFKLSGDETETVTVRLKPHLRDWILVGFAEGTVGYNTLHGNKESLGHKGVNDKWYHKGRVAFFAKGRIKGKWLMTMAYDSGRGKNDRKLFDKIDSNAYYTLYNDATTQGSEAPSRKKLYLKLERDAFSLLFGDYNTGLSQTDLASYSRDFTGLKSEYHGKNVEATLFVAETEELFYREEHRGDGTRGYYQLGQHPIIEGSEKITVEVRDQHREEIIIETRELQRYRDYDIDYDKGTLYFKDPIYSTDRAFNPRYIVVKYEVEGDGQDHYTYGGRVSVKSSDGKYEAGATYVNEETGAGDNRLYGVDAKAKLTDKLTLEAEYAKTKNGRDGNTTEGEAAKVTLEYKDDNLSARAYYRKQDAAFGLGQLSSSLSATRKIGVDASKKLSDKWTVAGTLYQNRKYDGNGTTTDENVLEVTANFKEKLWNGTFGYRYADNTETKATHQITAKVGRDFMEGNLSVWVSHDQSLGSNEDKEFPTKTALGVDYKYDSNTTLFAQLERRDSSDGVSWHSRAGVSYDAWKDGKITYSRLYDSGKDGTQIYDTMGLTRTLIFKEKWKVSLGYEKGIAWDDNSSTNRDFDAFNVGVNYAGEKYSSDLSVGYRNSDTEEKINLDAGVYIKQSDAMGLAFAVGYHKKWDDDTEDRKADAKLAFVYRPLETNWILMERLDFIDQYTKTKTDETQTRKLINNLHLNWQPNKRWELGLHYGLKHVIDDIDDVEYTSWTDLIGVNARYDINEKWSVGLQGSMLHSYTGNNIDYGFGLFVDMTPWENAELTLGYNIEGFDDDDFSQQNYYHEGPYIRLRMKFDQESIKSLVKGVVK